MPSLSYKTYNDLLRDIKSNMNKLPPDIDLVVGVPRSGIIPAYMVGLALSKPVCSINEFISGNYKINATKRVKLSNDIKNVLIIDDSVNLGNAVNKIKNIIEKDKIDKKFNITYAVVYYSFDADKFVDVALSFCPQPRIFQWNYMNHGALGSAALDIDGVLCIDPTDEQNDDGLKYKDFILNACPLYIPQYKVAALVTSRLEKYRVETETWLKNHGVQYDKLYMLENKTAEERRNEGMHGAHKAKIYKELNHCNLFIESEPSQAIEISNLSGKLCFCSKTDELFGVETPDNFNFKIYENKKIKFAFIRRIIALLIPFRNLRRKIRG